MKGTSSITGTWSNTRGLKISFGSREICESDVSVGEYPCVKGTYGVTMEFDQYTSRLRNQKERLKRREESKGRCCTNSHSKPLDSELRPVL